MWQQYFSVGMQCGMIHDVDESIFRMQRIYLLLYKIKNKISETSMPKEIWNNVGLSLKFPSSE